MVSTIFGKPAIFKTTREVSRGNCVTIIKRFDWFISLSSFSKYGTYMIEHSHAFGKRKDGGITRFNPYGFLLLVNKDNVLAIDYPITYLVEFSEEEWILIIN